MAFMMPPKAATQTIMTITQLPALEKPLYRSSLSHADRSAVPAMNITDTLKAVDGEYVTNTLDRDGFCTVQTPQVFDSDMLRGALKKAQKNDGLSEDTEKEAEDEVQKITDKNIKTIDEIVSAKEKEIMTV